jgi:hypothetical protein
MAIHVTKSVAATMPMANRLHPAWSMEPLATSGRSDRMGYPPALQPITSHDFTNASADLPMDRRFAWTASPTHLTNHGLP